MYTSHNTPQTLNRAAASTIPSTRHTPVSQSARARSRMAGALRNGTDFDPNPAELSQIEKEDLTRQRTRSEGGHDRERELMQSAIMVSIRSPNVEHKLTIQRNMSDQHPPRSTKKTSSMPPPKHQPRVRELLFTAGQY